MKRRTFLAAAIGAMFTQRPPARQSHVWEVFSAGAPPAGGYLVPPSMAPVFTGEIGRVEGFRFVMTSAPRRMLSVAALRHALQPRPIKPDPSFVDLGAGYVGVVHPSWAPDLAKPLTRDEAERMLQETADRHPIYHHPEDPTQ